VVEGLCDTDVLVVGAGPTGLALSAQLAAYAVPHRLVDRLADRAAESRALAIQPRTLEVLAALGVTPELVRRGNPAVRLMLHARGRAARLPLFDVALSDTAYPFLLFLSQATTEQVLLEHLAGMGVAPERDTELLAMSVAGDHLTCRLRHGSGGAVELLRARYLVGCDGAHSTVRGLAGIPFPGSDYPQTFVLADLEADGLQAGTAHAFLGDTGLTLFFPLRHPATWRLIAMQPPGTGGSDPPCPTLAELQALAAPNVPGVHLRDPVWATRFHLHSRAVTTMRSGRVFLAGDAAHIHSPAGAQGMNTGIQDAVNLGWKLALVLQADAPPSLLDTYHLERAPVARAVLRLADRGFRAATSQSPTTRFLRTRVAPRILPKLAQLPPARARGFRVLGQLAVHYRHSPLNAPATSRSRPRPGDRLPDAPLAGGTLHDLIVEPGFDLLLCGPSDAWAPEGLHQLTSWHPRLHLHQLPPGEPRRDDTHTATAGRALGVPDPAQAVALLVRPDGYVAYRGDQDLQPLVTYLRTWLPRPPARP
jgi:2-polyprenyl-6-methoxyphenol hydroxylase-like FAD-dependent oxidoreductase